MKLDLRSDIKFSVGDLVTDAVTNIVGMVTGISISIKDTGYFIIYEVGYPSECGMPDCRAYTGIELEKVNTEIPFGFGSK